MNSSAIILATLLTCGVALTSFAQTDVVASKNETAKVQSDEKQSRAWQFENLSRVGKNGKASNMRFMQEHLVVKRGESTRFKWVFAPDYLSRIIVRGVGESTDNDVRNGVYVVTVKPEKTTEYKYTYINKQGQDILGFSMSFTVIIVEPEEYEAVNARVENMTTEQRGFYIRKLLNKPMDPMEELLGNKMLDMSKEEATAFNEKLLSMSEKELEAFFESLMKEQGK